MATSPWSKIADTALSVERALMGEPWTLSLVEPGVYNTATQVRAESVTTVALTVIHYADEESLVSSAGGRHMRRDRTTSIRIADLGANRVPRQGDRLTDPDGDVWEIETVDMGLDGLEAAMTISRMS